MLDFERFRAHVDDVAASCRPNMVHVNELYLACACGAGDPQAVAILEERYLSQARLALHRLHAQPDFVDDVMQELRVKLLLGADPRIVRYGGRGDLAAWLRVAAARLAIDLLRTTKQGPWADRENVDSLGQADLGPEVRMFREAYRDAFNEVLAQVLAGLSAENRNLLRRHMVDHLTLEEMAAPYAVHPATIARRLSALRDDIAESVRLRLAARHPDQGGSASLESIAHAIRSQIDVSLTPLLSGERGEPDGGGGRLG
jgi:RNA polymerase sigma-70 factor (ECF subfamily)